VLAAAKGLQILGSPKDEIEGTLFSILNHEVDLPFKVSYCRRSPFTSQLNALVHRLHSTCGHS
jgi:hypothetical protein